jgi:NAD(P)H-dependent nitrite reductase small subunit
MINNNDLYVFDNIEYLKICKSDEIYEGKGKQFVFEEDDDFQIAIFRVNGSLYALDNICPHRHADRIFDGIIKDKTVMCPLHGWTYNLENGKNIDLRQGIKSLKSYKVFENDGVVYLEKPEFEIPKWRR